jgi:DNA-binding response OmpR family regulator
MLHGEDPTVLNVNAALLARLSIHIERVLVVDPFPGSARLICDMVRGMGAYAIDLAETTHAAFEMAERSTPQLIITELTGPEVDGLPFIRKVRKSALNCRQAPIIVVTSEATELTIKGARDSGAHEFLRKPFSAADLLKRVENVALKPRPWIEAVHYIGPCRRRFNSANYAGPRRRTTDKTVGADSTYLGRVDQSLRILKSAIVQFNDDKLQALRSIQAQIDTLQSLAGTAKDARMTYTVSSLINQVEPAARKGMKPTMPQDLYFDEVVTAAANMDRLPAA